jgi:dihydropteroate synthase
LPLAIGPSRKSFLRKEQESETEFATAAAVTACILSGAHIVRVHDVKAMKSVVDVADSIRLAGENEAEEPATQVRQQSTQARWQRGQ